MSALPSPAASSPGPTKGERPLSPPPRRSPSARRPAKAASLMAESAFWVHLLASRPKELSAVSPRTAAMPIPSEADLPCRWRSGATASPKPAALAEPRRQGRDGCGEADPEAGPSAEEPERRSVRFAQVDVFPARAREH